MAKATLNHVYKIYPAEKGKSITAVEDVNLEVADREFDDAVTDEMRRNAATRGFDFG